MTDSDVLVPGARDVRGTLTEPAEGANGSRNSIVVACPPHPQHGGSRSDSRLVAVAERLQENGIACLRFDYGAWDEGYGEREDVRNAIRWAADRYERVGVFGFSFGASLSLLAPASLDGADDPRVVAIAALAPTATLAPDLDSTAALESVSCPVRIVVGERDTTAEWEPVVERAQELAGEDEAGDENEAEDRDGIEVVTLPADHFFVGQTDTVAETVVPFLESALRTE
ncbi:alpha/beta hydrolase [Natrialba sp. SSL1]|uniref:alpha/beta hydrolase n=1 Tax=Natrialba sp. SSL1 TaxID=1869245 RepID=UPI0008F8C8A3|nr:alpha/beta hydrolase [Natrialba sp. SSL1]OIB57719.1 alpha/beta hydrolase [Natrialba sp. SSL1]